MSHPRPTGPSGGLFWALPPRGWATRISKPLTLVMFPSEEQFGAASNNCLARGDSLIARRGAMAPMAGSMAARASETTSPPPYRGASPMALTCGGYPGLLVEGLAEYTIPLIQRKAF